MGDKPDEDRAVAEQDLLFGIFAVQLGLASPRQVMLAASQWAVDRSLSLSDRLEQEGIVPAERAGMLRTMVSGAVEAHGGDTRDALDTFGGEKAVIETFGGSVVLSPDGEIVSSQELESLKPLPPGQDGEDELAEGRLKVTPVTPGRYSLRDRVRGRPTNLTQAAEIGRGGIGRVMVAFDEHLGREVALKELLPVRVGGSLDKIRVRPSKSDGKLEGQVKPVMSMERVSALVARFLREARVTGQLEHPNIVPVYELGRSADDTLYYTMKMVRGRTLAEALEACSGLSDRLALLPHFVDLCQAIAYAHSRGVVHRDLKPENVMLGEFGETVVLDWGLAKVRGSQDLRGQEIEREIQELRDVAGGHTVDGTALGTPAYMSPEQADGKLEEIDERSDVWSLGAVLFQILTGRPPYEGATAYEVIGKVLKDPVRPVTEITPAAPAELAAVCNKALGRDPTERYQAARELAAEVNAHLTGGRVLAYDYSLGDLLRRLFARFRVAFVTGGVSLLLLVSLGVWSYLRVVADRDRAEALKVAAERARTDARLKMAEAHWEGARSAQLRRDMLEARAKLRSSLEVTDSVAGRVLWAKLRAEPLVWKRVLGPRVFDVSFSPDGAEVAAAGMDGSIYLLDTRSGEARMLRGHKPWVASLAYSRDGKRLASAGSDKTIRIWDLSSGRAPSQASGRDPGRAPGALINTLQGHTASISDVAFSPDGALLASSGHDRSVRLWRVDSGAQLQVVTEPAVISWVLLFTPDGRQLLAGDRDGNIRVYRLERERLVEAYRVHQPEGGVAAMDLSLDGKRLATGGTAHKVFLWDVASLGPEAKPIGTLSGHTDGIGEVAFSPDGNTLASGSYDKTVRLWQLDWAHGKASRAPAVIREHTEWIAGVSFHPSGKFLATAAEDRAVALWRLPLGTGGQHLSRGHTDEVAEVAIDPTGKWIASGGADHKVRLWDLASGRERAVLTGPTDTVHGLGFTPDGRLRAVTWDRKVQVWAPADAGAITSGSPRAVQTLPGDGDLMTGVCLSASGRWIAAGDYDRTVRLWDLKTGRERVLKGHTDLIRALAFDPIHKRLASASWDRTVRVWDAASGRCLQVLTGHSAEVNEVAFVPDGRHLISTSWELSLRRWDLTTGQGELIGKADARYEVMEISPDGRWLACGTEAGTIDLWDLGAGAPGRLPFVLRGHRDLVAGLVFSPDGSKLISAGDDGTVRVWQVETGQPYWRAPLLLERSSAPPLVFTHQGWIVPGQGPVEVDLPERAWRAAAQAAQAASLDGSTACTISSGDRFELWDTAADRLSLQKTITGLDEVVAFDGGCAVRAAGDVTLFYHRGRPRPIASDATALGRAQGGETEQLLVAGGGQVRVFETDGLEREQLPADVGVTALVRLRHAETDYIAVGYRDGTVELTTPGARGRRSLALEEVSSSQVVRMLQGPSDTLILGYADGLLGLWDVRSGARLDALKLHGGLAHAAVHAGRLYVVTELGDHLAWDLSIFHADYCGLLGDVWAEVPVVWESGRPVLKEPPPDHPCRIARRLR